MKTFKDNIEFQIKKQIEERKIVPSRDLWSEIELHNNSNNSPKSKVNWFLVAACLMLTFSLGIALFFLNQSPEIKPQMVKVTEKTTADSIVKDPVQSSIPLAVGNNDKKDIKKNTCSGKKRSGFCCNNGIKQTERSCLCKETGNSPDFHS